MKYLFIVNPVSGGRHKHDWEAAIRDYFMDRPDAIEFYVMCGKGDQISIRQYIERINPDRVVAVGGDGTVKMLADIVKETPIALGIVPAGSANGMAKELGIPADVNRALDVLVDGSVKKIDLLRLNEEEICMHLSDIGLNAMLVKYFERSKKRGMLGYGKAIFRTLWQKQKLRVTIEADTGTYKRYAYMVVLANARKYGTGANINPDGNIADGRF
ncbi:MAG TPA: diacylglycerol kinase family protein, partial [Flavisolibacter sp.]